MRAVGSKLQVSSDGINKYLSIDARFRMMTIFDLAPLIVPKEFVQQAIDIELWNPLPVQLLWEEYFEVERMFIDDFEMTQIMEQNEF